eukprot:1821411-Pyramimonas_sp.AAC.1
MATAEFGAGNGCAWACTSPGAASVKVVVSSAMSYIGAAVTGFPLVALFIVLISVDSLKLKGNIVNVVKNLDPCKKTSETFCTDIVGFVLNTFVLSSNYSTGKLFRNGGGIHT